MRWKECRSTGGIERERQLHLGEVDILGDYVVVAVEETDSDHGESNVDLGTESGGLLGGCFVSFQSQLLSIRIAESAQ